MQPMNPADQQHQADMQQAAQDTASKKQESTINKLKRIL
jgi:hypothetical protein